jgi:hypothetical protein
MMTFLRFVTLCLVFWHFLRLVDHYFPRRVRYTGPWGKVVNQTIRDYIRREEKKILLNRRLLAMLHMKGGRKVVTIKAAEPVITGQFVVTTVGPDGEEKVRGPFPNTVTTKGVDFLAEFAQPPSGTVYWYWPPNGGEEAGRDDLPEVQGEGQADGGDRDGSGPDAEEGHRAP